MLISACHIVKFIVYSHGMSKVSTANVSAQFNLPFEKEAMISYQKDVKNLPKKKTQKLSFVVTVRRLTMYYKFFNYN